MKHFLSAIVVAVTLWVGYAASPLRTVVKEGKLLNQYAFIQTHDSATGELKDDRDYIVARWTRTQQGSIIDQLNCGARSLDYRPYLSEDGVLRAHHGPIVVQKPMEASLREIEAWTKLHPNELIIIQVSHCVEERIHNNYYAASCKDAVLSLLAELHVPVITDSDCSPLNTMTMESALEKGNLLAVFGCSVGYWDPSLTCSAKEYVCYNETVWNGNTSYIPWGNLERSLASWASSIPVEDGRFWGFGANWQSSVESVIAGTLHNSSLLLDEERSQLNAWTAQTISQGTAWKFMNMVGVDNVCDHGPEIFAAMQSYNSR